MVTGPDGNEYQSGPPTVDGAELSSAVSPLLEAGAYTIAYRVVSDDGHPVGGEIHFELAAVAVTPGRYGVEHHDVGVDHVGSHPKPVPRVPPPAKRPS